MLIYNFQKEFLGIDEKDLRSLGFKDLAGLRAEVADFADLFVKTPGFIHNFKHVHWIDFITCAESNEESKVIINVNNKNYRAVIQVTTAFLVDNPSSKAFIIHLHNLRELSAKESESISGDITQRAIPQAAPEPQKIFNTPEYSEEFEEESVELEQTTVTQDPYESPLEIEIDDAPLEVDAYDTPEIETPPVASPIKEEESYVAPLKIDIEEDISLPTEEPQEETIPSAPSTTTEMVSENFDNGYTYDPSVASEELGLPLDLIEEFIQDFIEQAKEFKPKLYQAIDESDLDNLKILSHKLKGVAANLRIEDAFEVLATINTSPDILEIKHNLDTLYKIIAKLSGEEIEVVKEVPLPSINVEEEEVEEEEEALTLDFKEESDTEDDDLFNEPIEINDSDVPDKIDMPELADDSFMESDSIDLLDIDSFEEDEIELMDDPSEDELPVIEYSKESVASEIGIDQESFNELFDEYLSEAGLSVKGIATALDDKDFPQLKKEATKLKGMSDNMRVTAFSQELQTLMNSTDKDALTGALKTVEASIAQLSNKEV